MSMRRAAYIAAALLVCAPVDASARSPSGFAVGRRLLDGGVFDPRRNFAGEVGPWSVNELILTIAASSREDWAPAYSLAIARICAPVANECRYRYWARLLRVPAHAEDDVIWFGSGSGIVDRIASGSSVRSALRASRVQWLEADVAACEGVIEAMYAVHRAEWRPDLPFSLTPEGTGELLIHPAEIRIEWSGANIRTRYVGWILADGIAAAARDVMDRLEPCWRPSTAPPPWALRRRSR